MEFIKLDKEIINKLNIKCDSNEEVYGLIKEKDLLGISIISDDFNNKNVINVYVYEKYRNNGYGTLILSKSIDIFKNKGYKELNFLINRNDFIVKRILFKVGAKHLSNNTTLAKYAIYL